MRTFLFALLAALLPAAADAAPFAQYTPATGDIAFRDVFDGHYIALTSAAGQLNPFMASLPLELDPPSADPPVIAVGSDQRGAMWRNKSGPFWFTFNALTIRGAITPHTPLADLSFLFHPRQSTVPHPAPIVVVPEPSSFALAVGSISCLVAVRQRYNPPARSPGRGGNVISSQNETGAGQPSPA